MAVVAKCLRCKNLGVVTTGKGLEGQCVKGYFKLLPISGLRYPRACIKFSPAK